MTRQERQVIYAPDALVKEARLKGMANLSQFCRAALQEYIGTGIEPSTATNPGSRSSNRGQNEG